MSTRCLRDFVSVLTLFVYRAFRARCIAAGLSPARCLFANIDFAKVDSYRAVYQPVDHGVCLNATAEPAVPLGRGVPGAEHGRVRHVALLDWLGRESDGHAINLLGESLAEYQQLVALSTFAPDHSMAAGSSRFIGRFGSLT